MALAYRRCQDGDLGFEKLQAAQSMQNLEVFSDANFVPVRMREGFAGCVVALESQAQPFISQAEVISHNSTCQTAESASRLLEELGFPSTCMGSGDRSGGKRLRTLVIPPASGREPAWTAVSACRVSQQRTTNNLSSCW